ncbi:uncharacterized protein PAN0_003c1776 [Moesziomyces antarcticus]|uniref:Uncharacterized protein n=1 Tax=Pseudozyma antarctica TaxID=84753 RepID=A0A5C3FID9_PSEA2|nr:uncharacterized protein PAN0_003c1776 [Moesziomyces antarcticus]GAK63571.1 hypothetical protein PAN0_003c1776 [Moesziomyces antarcticus]SPO44162.1 uncharacterized protein PSANT_01847 [Moesziomyces antarcticus]
MLKGATPTLRAAVAYNSDRGSARLCSASVGTLCARDQERIGIADTTTPQVPLSPLSHSDSQNDSHRGRSAAIPTSARSRFPPFVRLDAPSLSSTASPDVRGVHASEKGNPNNALQLQDHIRSLLGGPSQATRSEFARFLRSFQQGSFKAAREWDSRPAVCLFRWNRRPVPRRIGRSFM